MYTPENLISLMHHISCIIVGLTTTSYYLNMLTPKKNIRHVRLLCYLMAFISMFANALLFDNYTLAYTIGFFIALAGPVFFLFEQKISSCFLTYMVACFMYVFSENILSQCYLLLNLFMPEKNLVIRTMATSGQIFITLLNYIFVIAIFFILCKTISESFQKYFRHIQLRTLALLGTPLFITIVNCNLINSASSSSFGFYAIIFGCIFIISLYFIKHGLASLKTQELKRLKNENQKKELLAQLKHYETIYKEFTKQRKWRHDLANHLLTLDHLIEQGQLTEAKDYIKTLTESIRS